VEFIYTVEFYSAIKNEVILFLGKLVEVEIIILSKICQVQKDKAMCFISFVEDRYKG
jgi:hypothetical protein